MKKIYSLLISILPIAATAQITVTQSDLPGVGSYYINATDSTYAASIPAGGAGQTWNYATLQNLKQDTLGLISAASTPYASTFPLSNLAGHNVVTNTYVYFIANATGFYLNGAQAPGGVFNGFPLIYSPAQIYVPVPFTYNNTHNSFARFVYTDSTTQYPLTDSVRIIRHIASNILADGYGSLILPNATHPNTLRIKNTMLETDSILGHSTITNNWATAFVIPNQTTNYRWLQNGGGSLILEINADSAGQTATSSSYLLNYGVGVNEVTAPATNTNVYPNPATDFVSFNFIKTTGSHAQLTITNVPGETVELYDAGKLNQLTIGTNHLKNGIYFYSVSDENGKFCMGKFVVQH